MSTAGKNLTRIWEFYILIREEEIFPVGVAVDVPVEENGLTGKQFEELMEADG